MVASDEVRYCAALHCLEQVETGMLMCRQHWSMVPKALQAAVWRTWKAYRQTRTPCDVKRRQLDQYEAAREAAIAAVARRELES